MFINSGDGEQEGILFRAALSRLGIAVIYNSAYGRGEGGWSCAEMGAKKMVCGRMCLWKWKGLRRRAGRPGELDMIDPKVGQQISDSMVPEGMMCSQEGRKQEALESHSRCGAR